MTLKRARRDKHTRALSESSLEVSDDLLDYACHVDELDVSRTSTLQLHLALLQPAVADVDSHWNSDQVRIRKLHARARIDAVVENRIDARGVELLVERIRD